MIYIGVKKKNKEDLSKVLRLDEDKIQEWKDYFTEEFHLVLGPFSEYEYSAYSEVLELNGWEFETEGM